MAVANTKSVQITNLDATPPVANNPATAGGFLRVSVGTVETAAADDDGSVYRFCRVPTNATILSVKVFCDTITAGTVFDCGFYNTAFAGGAVVDADAFASNVDLSTAITTGTEIRFEAADINTVAKRAWELASGVTSDPGGEYDICLTGDTVGSAAGTISLQVIYAV